MLFRSDHADWRRAAVASLARAMAPARVNGLVSDDEAAIAAALAYLDSAAGVTGHVLPLEAPDACARLIEQTLKINLKITP